MNKNIPLITVALALSLSGVGCNKSGKLDKASTFTPPSGPVELKLKWPQGERVIQNFDMKQNMEIFVPNQPNPIKQDMTMGQEYGLSVLKENPDGGHEVEMEFLSARMSIVMEGQTFNYDSAKKSSAAKFNISWTPATTWNGSRALMPLSAGWGTAGRRTAPPPLKACLTRAISSR